MRIKGFLKLLGKYRAGTLPEDRKELMDQWYDTIGNAREDLPDKGRLKSRMWEAIASRTEEEGAGAFGHRSAENSRWLPRRAGIAAALLLSLALGGYYLVSRKAVVPERQEIRVVRADWLRVENKAGGGREVMLEDGSCVVLEPGGVIQYPREFSAESRTVYAEGEVFFDVARDPAKPFIAYAGGVVVRVLGTSFRVRELPESAATEVAVLRGKVMVEKAENLRDQGGSASDESKIVLTPNRKVTFFKNSDRYVTGLIENPVLVDNSEEYVSPEAFDFDEVPLGKILDKLEKAYGVSIGVSDGKVLDCLITADLSSDNLYGKIELISAILNASYEIKGNSVLLSGCVCNVLENK